MNFRESMTSFLSLIAVLAISFPGTGRALVGGTEEVPACTTAVDPAEDCTGGCTGQTTVCHGCQSDSSADKDGQGRIM